MSFSEEKINAVWDKRQKVLSNGKVSTEWGKDQCDAWIKRSDYGNRKSDYGWEIDHIKTQANGGTDELGNLRPLHWENNVAKSDGKLKCVIISSGDKNIAA